MSNLKKFDSLFSLIRIHSGPKALDLKKTIIINKVVGVWKYSLNRNASDDGKFFLKKILRFSYKILLYMTLTLWNLKISKTQAVTEQYFRKIYYHVWLCR